MAGSPNLRAALGALFVVNAAAASGIPPEWRKEYDALSLLYVENDANLPATQMPMIGNGYLATQIGSDSMFVAGVYNGHATEAPSHRARIPSTVNIRAPGTVNHAALSLREATYYRRSFIPPWKDAWVGFAPCGPWWANTASDSCTSSPDKLWLEQRFYAHRVLRSLLVHEVEAIGTDPTVGKRMLARHGEGALYRKAYATPADLVRSGEDISAPGNARPLALAKIALNPGAPSVDIGFHDMTRHYAGTHPGCGTEWGLRVGNINTPESADSEVVAVAVLTSGPIPHDGHLAIARSGVTYASLTIVKTSLDLPHGASEDDLVAAAVEDYRLAVALAADGVLHATHVAAWGRLWEAGVEVGGRPEVASIINASLYSVTSTIRADWPFGSSPGGLSTNGYNGHQFWDWDTFGFPTYSLLHPLLAQSTLLYRLHRLPGARAKAASYPRGGYGGSMWPWESAFSGIETCPSWAPTGQHEVHISSDVAVSVWQYWQATRDGGSGWLREVGFPILSGVADFWTSRLVADTPGAVVAGYNDVPEAPGYARARDAANPALWEGQAQAAPPPDGGPSCALSPGACPLHITDVIPPTEFYHHSSDSVFTSAGAKLALERAVQAARALGLPASSGWGAWANASARVYIPFTPFSQLAAASGKTELPGLGNLTALAASSPGSESGVHPYFAGYRWGEGKVQLLDPAMLWWPLGITDTHPTAGEYRQSRANYLSDVAYYGAHQDPGGSVAFSWAFNSIAWAEAGDPERAEAFFVRSHENFVFGPFRIWAEGFNPADKSSWGSPNFITGAGGFLEAALFGWPRLRVNDSSLSMRPLMMAGASEHKLRGLAYLGNRLDVTITPSHVTLEVTGPLGVAGQSDYDGVAALAPGSGFPFRSEALTALLARVSATLPPHTLPAGDDGLGAPAVTSPADPRNHAAGVRQALAARPWLSGTSFRVSQRALTVIDESGAAHDLEAGKPVTLPTQALSVVAREDWLASRPTPPPSPTPSASSSPAASPSPTPSPTTSTSASGAPAKHAPAAEARRARDGREGEDDGAVGDGDRNALSEALAQMRRGKHARGDGAGGEAVPRLHRKQKHATDLEDEDEGEGGSAGLMELLAGLEDSGDSERDVLAEALARLQAQRRRKKQRKRERALEKLSELLLDREDTDSGTDTDSGSDSDSNKHHSRAGEGKHGEEGHAGKAHHEEVAAPAAAPPNEAPIPVAPASSAEPPSTSHAGAGVEQRPASSEGPGRPVQVAAAAAAASTGVVSVVSPA